MSEHRRTIPVSDDRGVTARCGLILTTLEKPLWTVPENALGWQEADAPEGINPCDGCWRTLKVEA